MKFIITLLLLLQFNAFASNWNLEFQDSGKWLLFSGDYSAEFFQTEAGEGPKFAKIHEHEKLQIIVLSTGDAGTTSLAKIQHAAIFNKASKKFLGLFPYQSDGGGSLEIKWTNKDNKLEIFDPNTYVTHTIDF